MNQIHIYKLTIYGNTLDYVHNAGERITELYVPELDLYVNKKASFIDYGKNTRCDGQVEIKEIPSEEYEKLKLLREKLEGKIELEQDIVSTLLC